jgi:hypothetical protein
VKCLSLGSFYVLPDPPSHDDAFSPFISSINLLANISHLLAQFSNNCILSVSLCSASFECDQDNATDEGRENA